MKDYRLTVLGEGAVGKSAITIQFIQNVYIDDYDPTIEDSYRKQVTIDKEECILQILDTAGQEEFYSAMRDRYMRSTEAFICVYSITSCATLHALSAYREQFLRVKDVDKVPMILVGNKCDLENARVVSVEEGKRYAKNFDCPFIETSAKTNHNIQKVFFTVVRELIKANAPKVPQKHKSSKSCVLL
jgi:GTPase KRas